jgi:hypothetical protein
VAAPDGTERCYPKGVVGMRHIYRRAKRRWFWPRVKQLWSMLVCALSPFHHPWSKWRIETEFWFEYVDKPEPYAWRCCQRCSLLEHVR